jgi:quinoprotein glucose dehydrogenase
MKQCAAALVLGAAVVAISSNTGAGAQSDATRAATPSTEWPTYGHDPGGMRFSPVAQITPANVSQLEVAWVYHMRPATTAVSGAGAAGAPAQGRGRGRGRGGSGFAQSETTPLVVNGVMYLTTPYGRVVALDPTTGKEVWVFEVPAGNPSTRGVEYWAGDARTPPQIVFGTGNGRLYSVDAKTGRPNDAFGDHGSLDLNTPEILQGMPGSVGLSSPPTMFKHLIITGSRNQENPPRGPAGDVRAWDIHTGKLVWTFRAIPGPGEKYNDTWAGDSWKNRSGVNVWGFITVDVQRGIVYMPFGAPSTTSSARASWRRTPARESTCGISRSCITTSGTPTCRPRRR